MERGDERGEGKVERGEGQMRGTKETNNEKRKIEYKKSKWKNREEERYRK